MHNKRIKIVIIVGVIYLVLLLSVDVIKVLNNKPSLSNNKTTGVTNGETFTSLSPRSDEETTEVTESTTETTGTSETTTNGVPHEEGTTGSTKQQNTTNNTMRGTTTTTKAIPSKISCSNREKDIFI